MRSVAQALAVSLVLAGCGKQLRRPDLDRGEVAVVRDDLAAPAWEALRQRQARVADLEYRLRIAAGDACPGDRVPVLGVVARSRKDVAGRDLRGVVQGIFRLGDHPTVLHVVPDSPAASAGLARGDVLVRIDGRSLEVERDLRDALRDAHSTLELDIARDGVERAIRVDAPLGCRIEVGLSEYDEVAVYEEPYGERGRPFVTAGLVRFVESDDELLVALAHGLALAILRDEREEAQDPVSRDAVERRMTQLAIRLAARAGAGVSRAAGLWERIALEQPETIIQRQDKGTPVEQTRYPLPLRIAESRAAARALAGEGPRDPEVAPGRAR